jgi:hypothetical protein
VTVNVRYILECNYDDGSIECENSSYGQTWGGSPEHVRSRANRWLHVAATRKNPEMDICPHCIPAYADMQSQWIRSRLKVWSR